MNLVLVHGGGVDGSCWQPLLSHLDAPTWVLDLPGRGAKPGDLTKLEVTDFVDSIVGDLVDNDLTDVVLVGHSLAGILLPSVAATARDRLRQLVFVGAAVPPDGKSVAEVLPSFSPATAELAARIGDDLIAPDGTLHADLATAMFCNDMNAEQTSFTLSCLVPEAAGLIDEPIDLRGLPDGLPCTYVRLLRDASLTVRTQEDMAANLGSPDVIDLDAGHMAMISQPRQLAAILNAFAEKRNDSRGSNAHR